MKKNNDYIIIVPAYNEEATIGQLVREIKRYADVCIVNDCSTDSTPEILDEFDDIHVIHHKTNTNITGAIIDGMRYAVQEGYEYAITMDAGMSHNPAEIPIFLGCEKSDIVIGTRFKKFNTPMRRRLLSSVGNFIYNLCLDFPCGIVTNKYIRDIPSGYRCYSRDAMKMLTNNIEKYFAKILRTIKTPQKLIAIKPFVVGHPVDIISK
jgi:dolichol-phosphate mannosyltransferase